jgi:hypothetical protein
MTWEQSNNSYLYYSDVEDPHNKDQMIRWGIWSFSGSDNIYLMRGSNIPYEETFFVVSIKESHPDAIQLLMGFAEKLQKDIDDFINKYNV